jgi:hypothetical protein
MVGDALTHFGEWLQNSPWGLGVGGSGSYWLFPGVQALHFTGLSLWIGTSLAVDLSLIGLGKNRCSALELSDALFFWNWAGLGMAILGGFLLFSISAVALLNNPAFQTKIGIVLPIGLIWHIVVQRKTRDWGKTLETPPVAKAAGAFEILLWVSVVTSATLIPYF